MFFVSKITPIFALLTFRERKLAHQASFLWPLSVGRAFYFPVKGGEFLNCEPETDTNSPGGSQKI